MKKTSLVLLGAALAVSVLLTACGNGATTQQPAEDQVTEGQYTCVEESACGAGEGCKCSAAKECGKAECGTTGCAKGDGEGCKCSAAKECGKAECGTTGCAKGDGEGCKCSAAKECGKAECGSSSCAKGDSATCEKPAACAEASGECK